MHKQLPFTTDTNLIHTQSIFMTHTNLILIKPLFSTHTNVMHIQPLYMLKCSRLIRLENYNLDNTYFFPNPDHDIN